MNNRMWNITNPNQGQYKRVLCVCSAGLLRSPTMARVFAEEYNYNTRAAGITKEYALIPVDEALVAWAHEIVCAESWMMKTIKAEYPGYLGRIIALDIPDQFEYMNHNLVELIKEKYEILQKQD